MKKNYAVYAAFAALAIFGVLGWAHAESGSASIDSATLDQLFDVVFHRPADAGGRAFHIRHDLKTILNDFRHAPEQRYYGALFKAVKAYEVAQRAPGTLTDVEKQSYLDLIDSALSNLVAWVDTLPDQDPCLGVISPLDARDAIVEAHGSLSVSAQASGEKAVFSGEGNIGRPENIRIFPKCARPTPRPSPVFCTQDAMQCPDGTFVGRKGPNCEFVCPTPMVNKVN